MTIAYSYQYIYLIIVGAITFFIKKSYIAQNGRFEYKHSDSRFRDILIVLFFILFIGFRPSSTLFTDMGAYSNTFARYEGTCFSFNLETDNIIFDNYLLWCATTGVDKTVFFISIATIYFLCAYIGIRRIFPTHTLPAYIVFLGAFSTFSYGTNGIKAGAATSIFIMALGFYNKKTLCIAIALLSYGFHHSMQLPFVALLITMFYKNPKWYFYGWFVCLLMAMLHITYFQNLLGGMTDDQGAGYLLVTEDITAGGIRFRPDFILYSAMPIWIGYQFEMKKKITSKVYSTLLHLYLITNGIWMLCMYAPFNNRIAYLSWFVYPIVLIYPFLYVDNSVNKYIKFSKAMKYHFYFTLFMVLIYYGLFSQGH